MINGYIFYFLGQLFSGQLFELFARETNLKKQSSVNWTNILAVYCQKDFVNLPLYDVWPLRASMEVQNDHQ